MVQQHFEIKMKLIESFFCVCMFVVNPITKAIIQFQVS